MCLCVCLCVPGEEHLRTVRAAINLGQAYERAKRPQDAVNVLSRVWPTAKRVLKDDQTGHMILYQFYACCLYQVGDHDGVHRVAKEATKRGLPLFEFERISNENRTELMYGRGTMRLPSE